MATRQASIAQANRLVTLAEHAYALRKMDVVEEVSNALVEMPLPVEYSCIGRYFKGICVRESGKGALALSTSLLESVARHAPAKYKAKALLSLGRNAREINDTTSRLGLYSAAARIAASNWCDPATVVEAHRMLAVFKSEDGDHRGSLADLEGLFPMARAAGSSNPHIFVDYLNSLAVEFAEAGRLKEATNVSDLVISSPFAQAYPEWMETRAEITRRGRGESRWFVPTCNASPNMGNMVAESSLSGENVAAKPVIPDSREAGESENHNKTARLLIFPNRKGRPAVGDNGCAPLHYIGPESGSMSSSAKRAVVAGLLLEEDSPAAIDRMLEAAGLVAHYHDHDELPRRLDLESPGELEELIRRWLNGAIEPEELAAVLSALRDCEDEFRRINILDQMISVAFVETVQHYESEREWRKRVEARLASIRGEPHPA